VVIWHIFTLFGILYQEKSGNPGRVKLNATGKQRLSLFIRMHAKQTDRSEGEK
jgi:hypothetical protein